MHNQKYTRFLRKTFKRKNAIGGLPNGFTQCKAINYICTVRKNCWHPFEKKRISKKDILGSKATIIQDSKSLSYWIRISIGLVLERPPKRVWNKLYKRLYRVVDFL